MRAFPKYLLFQLPGWLLGLAGLLFVWPHTGYESWIGAVLLLAWILKDLLLYPLLRDAYEGRVKTGGARLIGTQGTARDRLDPHGYVLVGGELWRARVVDATDTLEPGSSIVVVGAEGLVLSVMPTTAAS